VVRQLAELRQLAQDALAGALAAMKRAEAEHDAANDPSHRLQTIPADGYRQPRAGVTPLPPAQSHWCTMLMSVAMRLLMHPRCRRVTALLVSCA
jgi:hypothetical protein